MRAWHHRVYDRAGAPYWVGVVTGMRGVCMPGYEDGLTWYAGQPMASAVMDDFGNLVVIGFWK